MKSRVNPVLKAAVRMAVPILKSKLVLRTVNDVARAVAERVHDSLKKSADSLDTIEVATPDARAMQAVVGGGVNTAKAVTGVIAEVGLQKDAIVQAAVNSLAAWAKNDADSGIDLSTLTATLANAIGAVQKGRDDIALPMLKKLDEKDLQTIIKDIVPGLVKLDLNDLLNKLQIDNSDEGKMIRELLLIMISAVNAARHEMVTQLKAIGLGSLLE